ncbi:MAG: c-type cytochrome domain-containing protein [Pirellulales bacterium]
MSRKKILACLLNLIIVGSCLGDDAKTNLMAEVKEILRGRCVDCHGSAASSTEFDVLDAKSLIEGDVVKPGKPEESKLLNVLVSEDEETRMPQDQPALSSSEVDKIRKWISEGASAFPADVTPPKEDQREDSFSAVAGVDYVLKQILAHQRSLVATNAKSMRYFSCNHLLTRGATRDELDLQRDALVKSINHLTYSRDPVMIEAVDGETATIFAVDIRKLGWHHDTLKAVGSHGKMQPALNNYDMLLLEYPYAIAYHDSDTYEKLTAEFLGPSRMVRPIAYVRIDWFCSVATAPPLYHDLMHMPMHVSDLEREIIGVDVEAEMMHKNVARGAVILSGVSRNNRAAERFISPHGAYWKSIDYATNKGNENIFRDPIHLHGVGGEMIFNLPNGLHGYYLSTAAGDRLEAGPTEIVTDKFAEDKVVRNALSCIRCHDQGIKTFKDSVRPAVESMPGNLGFSRSEVLKLYPKQEELSALFKADTLRFQLALEKVLGHPQKVEPLAPVTRRFLEDPITLTAASGELGLMKTGDLGAVFRSRQFAALGLVPLASQGAVRRDTWEDYFDQIVRELGLGDPIVSLDSNTRHDYAPLGHGPDIKITTTKNSRTFSAGDQIAVLVTNQGKAEVCVELIGTGIKGEKVVLVPAGVRLGPGAMLRFPKTGTITVKPSLGHELITVFASEVEFAAGVLYRGKNIADRYVHELDSQRTHPIIKKSLVIETR